MYLVIDKFPFQSLFERQSMALSERKIVFSAGLHTLLGFT